MSASQQNQNDQDDYELFECTNCGQQVEQILSLSCDHNLCIACAAKSLKRQPHQQNKFVCQICGEITNLDSTAFELLQSMSSARKTTLNNYLSVSLQSLSEFKLPTQTNVTCLTHPSEPAVLYCFNCDNKCFCMECFLSGNHKNHDVRNVQKAYDLMRLNKAEIYSNQLRCLNDSLLNDQCRLANKKKELIDLVASAKLQIQNNFDHLYQQLEKKEKELLQAAEEMVQDSIQEIDNMLINVRNHQSKFTSYQEDIAKHFPESVPPLTICIESFNYIATEQKKIQKSLEEDIKSTFQPFLQLNYCLNLESIEQQIDDIGKLKMQVSSLRGIETNGPTQREEFFFKKAQQERRKENDENLSQYSFIERSSKKKRSSESQYSAQSPSDQDTRFENRLEAARRILLQRTNF